ncbi:MAG: YraN family protein [Alphaproteobacteria bacterium]|jgi:putative endonuclease|nr:YraN family protein [Alphaproteobacteria bacterium]
MTINADQKGRLAEEKARLFLENKGYKTAFHRYKTPYGEIDFLMTKEKTLIAVEVKYRNGPVSNAAASITLYQKQRIQNALLHFLQGQPSYAVEYPFIQFDVVLLCSSKAIVHIPNAWQIEGEFL